MNNNIEELVVYRKFIEEKKAEYVDYPMTLPDELKDYLKESGINKLYSHQAMMYEEVRKGKNVVITTSTASGKTLSFLLPVLADILRDPSTRAIFIYPTKALASDQYRAIRPVIDYFGSNRIEAGVYDGDTPVNERRRIRNKANIILTNPDMLNSTFLPNHSSNGFDFIFSNLKYIVIDELHSYRGAFGSHLANVFRRLKRITSYYGQEVQFLCSSATIANPVELAQNVCGVEFELIDRDGSYRNEREYLLVQPPAIYDNNGNEVAKVSAGSVASDLIAKLTVENNSFITFVRSRRNVEIVLKESRDKLNSSNFMYEGMSDKIAGYRGGYTPSERKSIEQKMVNGDLRGLISTNALELGIDIGKIDTTVIVSFPGTRASFWQQSGRAGRNKKKSTNYLILDNRPIDQYIGIEPDYIFENSNENAIIDKDNLSIQIAHIRAAAAELPLTLDDISLFPQLGEIIPVLLRASEVMSANGKFVWRGGAYPAGDFSMRNIDNNRYKLVNRDTKDIITEMDELQAFQEIHEGAVYMHESNQYTVIELNLETQTGICVPFDGNYYTVPDTSTTMNIIKLFRDKEANRSNIMFGDIRVHDIVTMYKKMQFHTHENLGFAKLNTPLIKEYETESTWIKVPYNVAYTYRKMIITNETHSYVFNNHFEGMCFAIKNSALMVTMTERDDIDVKVSNDNLFVSDDASEDTYIYIYDKYVGGLGYSEKIYDLVEDIIENAKRMVSSCKCKSGCPACVGDYHLDKQVVLWGLDNMKSETDAPDSIKDIPRAVRRVVKKKIAFNELPTKWNIFVVAVGADQNSFDGFLSAVNSIEIKDSELTLYVNNDFTKAWAADPINKKSIENIFRHYVECPADFTLTYKVSQDAAKDYMEDRLKRRYDIIVNDRRE